MKIEKLMDAIGAIAPEYVEEAEMWEKRTARRRGRGSGYVRWRRILLPVAACLVLVVAGGTAGLWYVGNIGGGSAADGIANNGGADNGAADMAAGAAGAGSTSDGGSAPGGSAMDAEEGEQDAGMRQESIADECVAGPDAEIYLVVNQADSFSISIADHAEPAREIYYTAEELEHYYGIRIIPEELPAGLALPEDMGETPYVVGYDQNGAVLIDNCKLMYVDVAAGRELEIAARTIDTGEMRSFEGSDQEMSHIYGQAVLIGSIGEEYLATYKAEGVTVTVWSRGLSERELQAVLEELLGERK